jgi:hypothetical protein
LYGSTGDQAIHPLMTVSNLGYHTVQIACFADIDMVVI